MSAAVSRQLRPDVRLGPMIMATDSAPAGSMLQPVPAVTLSNDDIRVIITPAKGCDIRQITTVRTGQTVLAEMPWTAQMPDPSPALSDSVTNWMRAYPGGWQVLLPNAGDAAPSVGQGFHGEASISAWAYEHDVTALRARLDCYVQPLRLEREISIAGPEVRMREAVKNTGVDVEDFLWNHHIGFGGDLLDAEVELSIDASDVSADGGFDSPGNALAPGVGGTWPLAQGVDGEKVDLRRPLWDRSALAYVSRLSSGNASLRRLDGSLGVNLTWASTDFPTCWLWEELGGWRGAPFFGRGRVIGIEPCISFPGRGLDVARSTGQKLVRLAPGETRRTEIALAIEVRE